MLKTLIMTVAFLFSCGGEKKETIRTVPAPTTQPNPSQPRPNPQPAGVTFAGDIKPLLDSNCALSGCHANAAYLKTKDAFLNSNGPRRILNGSMPPPYSPDFGKWNAKDKKLILDWYDDNF